MYQLANCHSRPHASTTTGHQLPLWHLRLRSLQYDPTGKEHLSRERLRRDTHPDATSRTKAPRHMFVRPQLPTHQPVYRSHLVIKPVLPSVALMQPLCTARTMASRTTTHMESLHKLRHPGESPYHNRLSHTRPTMYNPMPMYCSHMYVLLPPPK